MVWRRGPWCRGHLPGWGSTGEHAGGRGRGEGVPGVELGSRVPPVDHTSQLPIKGHTASIRGSVAIWPPSGHLLCCHSTDGSANECGCVPPYGR